MREYLGVSLKKLTGVYAPGPGLVAFKLTDPLWLLPRLNPPCCFLAPVFTRYEPGPGVPSTLGSEYLPLMEIWGLVGREHSFGLYSPGPGVSAYADCWFFLAIENPLPSLTDWVKLSRYW